MLSRFTACCLALLVFAPFTAPFSTCDLALLVGRPPARHAPMAPAGGKTVGAELNVASVPALTRVGRERLQHTSDARPRREHLVTRAVRVRSEASARRARGGAQSATILRV